MGFRTRQDGTIVEVVGATRSPEFTREPILWVREWRVALVAGVPRAMPGEVVKVPEASVR